MSPITEASGDAGFVVTTGEIDEDDDEEDTEEVPGLGAISEYQYSADQNRPLTRGTRGVDASTSPFELEDDDLSPNDGDDTDEDVVEVGEEDEDEAPREYTSVILATSS
jgi:hypothetical protein